MSKGILSFKLPEEREEFELAQKAGALYSALHEVSQELRRLQKYTELTEDQAKLLQQIREKFWQAAEGLLD